MKLILKNDFVKKKKNYFVQVDTVYIEISVFTVIYSVAMFCHQCVTLTFISLPLNANR